MKMKNDCERDYIKEAFDKLYTSVMPYIDLTQFADARTAFQELDKKVHSEIYILKKCLAERDRAVDAGLTRSEVDRKRISDMSADLLEANNRIEALRRENDSLRVTTFNTIDEKEKEINALNKKIHELEEENANLRVTPEDLMEENETLRSKIEALDISKRPWHGDGNTMTGVGTCCKSLTDAIEFQNKKIEELEAEKERLKEAYDIQETTIKRLKLFLGKEHKENVDLSYGHEFEFGDEVFVPWSCDPYMYIKRGQLYNPRTKRLVYVGKDQHLKWFGEKFSIV